MRLAFLALAAVAALAAAPAPGLAQTPFRAVATVNESVITAWDVDQRVRILRLTGGAEAEARDLSNAALDGLVENRLMLQAGREAGIEPSGEMISEGLSELAARAGTDAAAFRARLTGGGVSDQAIDDMVGAQMVWRQVVHQRFANQIEPGEAEIDAEIALAGERRTTAYRIREIGLPATADGRTSAETMALADQIVRELREGADFTAAVQRYSAVPSAGQDGVVGWVDAAGLPPELSATLAALEPGEVAAPMQVQGGVSILRVDDIRRTDAEGLDASDGELRDRVRRELVTGRLERLADGLLQELRRDALIQVR